ncbi:MAG: CopD family protein [Marinobacter sp.]|uniref:CopD family protein n=1 Tax=Marinobacter sp. TaxID=50741 RepID=UPI003298CAAE
MDWLLVLHIITLVFWVAGLIYIPALVVGSHLRESSETGGLAGAPNLPRVIFTHVVTPFALAAIIAGTLVFVLAPSIGIWLIAKLTLVVVLVSNHLLLGLLITRAEALGGKSVRRCCLASGLTTCLLAAAILWIVLAKPAFEGLL